MHAINKRGWGRRALRLQRTGASSHSFRAAAFLQLVRSSLQVRMPRVARQPFRLMGVTAALLAASVTPAAAQPAGCPLLGDADVSRAVGSTVSAPSYFVIDTSSSTQCLFQGDAVGDGVLIGRYQNFFGSEVLQPFSLDQERLRTLLADGLPTGAPVDVVPVDGLGDAAAWVTPVDPSTAPDSLGRLLIRRGSDAYVVGVTADSSGMATATSVAHALLGT